MTKSILIVASLDTKWPEVQFLNELIKQFPGMEKALFVKKDKLLNNVEVYLNHASAYPNELVKPVKDGDEIHLVVMLTGG